MTEFIHIQWTDSDMWVRDALINTLHIVSVSKSSDGVSISMTNGTTYYAIDSWEQFQKRLGDFGVRLLMGREHDLLP